MTGGVERGSQFGEHVGPFVAGNATVRRAPECIDFPPQKAEFCHGLECMSGIFVIVFVELDRIDCCQVVDTKENQ